MTNSRTTFHNDINHIKKDLKLNRVSSLYIGYGEIIEVNEDTSQVKIIEYDQKGEVKREIPGFIPIINPLSQIHLLWGQLRKGLTVRVFWRGTEQDLPVLAEVIGDEGIEYFLKEEGRSNVMETGAYQLFSGGMSAY